MIDNIVILYRIWTFVSWAKLFFCKFNRNLIFFCKLIWLKQTRLIQIKKVKALN